MITSVKSVLIRRLIRPLFIRLGISRFSKTGLYGLDDKLAPYLNFKNGFFVELGANDGINQSNTFYLEKIKGWRGVLIEPIPRLYEKAKKNRGNSQVINAACVPFDFEKDFIEITDLGLMSFVQGALAPSDEDNQLMKGTLPDQVVEKIKVKTRTLNDILLSCGVEHIDFLSLDVEGFEADVLNGLDLNRFKPTYILIEARYRDIVESIILTHYEPVLALTHHDMLYKRSAHA